MGWLHTVSARQQRAPSESDRPQPRDRTARASSACGCAERFDHDAGSAEQSPQPTDAEFVINKPADDLGQTRRAENSAADAFGYEVAS